LSSISNQALAARLAADQPYASTQPGWGLLVERLKQLGAYELRRGAHPQASAHALRRLLEADSRE
jgi:hypothetical protein